MDITGIGERVCSGIGIIVNSMLSAEIRKSDKVRKETVSRNLSKSTEKARFFVGNPQKNRVTDKESESESESQSSPITNCG